MSKNSNATIVAHRRIARGECPECGDIYLGDKYRCKNCRIKHAAKMKDYRVRKILKESA